MSSILHKKLDKITGHPNRVPQNFLPMQNTTTRHLIAAGIIGFTAVICYLVGVAHHSFVPIKRGTGPLFLTFIGFIDIAMLACVLGISVLGYKGIHQVVSDIHKEAE